MKPDSFVELCQRTDVARKLVPPGVSPDDDVAVEQPELDVQHIQYAAKHALGDGVLAQDGELVSGLTVERSLEDVPVRRRSAHLSRLRVAVQEYPRLRGYAVQHDGAVRGHDDLQSLPQGAALQLEHRLLLGVGVQAGVYLVDENQCIVEP